MTFVEAASGFEASVSVRRLDQEDPVDGKSIMQMLMLAGTCGTEIETEGGVAIVNGACTQATMFWLYWIGVGPGLRFSTQSSLMTSRSSRSFARISF